jgi:hypothetical protein
MPRRRASGVLGLFEDPDATLTAARAVRDAGYRRWDVHSPFPIHGMDEAMGLSRSPVPWITFGAGVVGCGLALFILFGTMVYSWPANYGGKPHAAWPSFIPITFEMTVLIAGVCTALGSLWLGGVLQRAYATVLRGEAPVLDLDLTSHRFGIFIEADDPKFDEAATLQQLRELGACEVRALGVDDEKDGAVEVDEEEEA